jgi:hypothetical protein
MLLSIDGIKVDTITSVAATEDEITDQHLLKSLLELLTQCLDAPYPDSASTCIEAFWRSLIKDTYRGRPAGEEARAAFPLFIIMKIWQLKYFLNELHEVIEAADPTTGPPKPLELKSANLSKIHSQTKKLICSLLLD